MAWQARNIHTKAQDISHQSAPAFFVAVALSMVAVLLLLLLLLLLASIRVASLQQEEAHHRKYTRVEAESKQEKSAERL